MRNLFRRRLAAAGLLLAVAGAGHAARPFITDDARIVDPGACQVETWFRFNRDSNEYWALPGCNPTGNLELTVGGAYLPADEPYAGRSTLLQVQAMTLFRALTTNGWGVGLAAGGVIRPEDVALQVPQLYAYVPASFSLRDDRVVIHANLGAAKLSRAAIDHAASPSTHAARPRSSGATPLIRGSPRDVRPARRDARPSRQRAAPAATPRAARAPRAGLSSRPLHPDERGIGCPESHSGH